MEQDHRTGLAIIETVAERKGIDPLEVEPPLYESVDVDALEALFRSRAGQSTVTISFEYAGYLVTLEGPDTVRLTPLASDAAEETHSQDQSFEANL
ncbi:HalOD1 output domain-containing protein [Natronosalvus vescus]|uniref:HalOD1 output domain-containing protein n=1 Tax=Natronosalvus vescus TaxID=2953881 RepID=UPI002091D356|nr:HalOD1 output domain-containing protein [Natronosalvus vescus]